MAMEVGKSRLEALGDTEETADLIRYYCQQVEDHDGFVAPMGSLTERERNVSVLRPFGVWAVISPFNFPMALAAGPAGAALAAGNTVVLKPSPQGSFTAAKLYDCFRDAGLDPDVLHVLGNGRQQGLAALEIMRRKRAAVTGLFAGFRQSELVDAAPRHDLERGLHDPALRLAPPFGVGFYAACAIGKVPPKAAISRVWPYLGALFLALLVISAVPWISIGSL